MFNNFVGPSKTLRLEGAVHRKHRVFWRSNKIIEHVYLKHKNFLKVSKLVKMTKILWVSINISRGKISTLSFQLVFLDSFLDRGAELSCEHLWGYFSKSSISENSINFLFCLFKIFFENDFLYVQKKWIMKISKNCDFEK